MARPTPEDRWPGEVAWMPPPKPAPRAEVAPEAAPEAPAEANAARWSLPDGRVLAVPLELPAAEHRLAEALVRREWNTATRFALPDGTASEVPGDLSKGERRRALATVRRLWAEAGQPLALPPAGNALTRLSAGFLDTAALGAADEAIAALRSAPALFDDRDFGREYEGHVAHLRELQGGPAYHAGQVAGLLSPGGLARGVEGAVARKVESALAHRVGARLAGHAAGGAVAGTAYGAGAANDASRAGGAALGAITGSAGGLIGGAVAPVASRAVGHFTARKAGIAGRDGRGIGGTPPAAAAREVERAVQRSGLEAGTSAVETLARRIVNGEGGQPIDKLVAAVADPPATLSPVAREIVDRIIAKALGIPGEAARIGRVLLQRSPIPLAPRHVPAGAEAREAIARAFGDLPPRQRRLLIRELLKRGATDRSIQDAVAATAATGAPAAAFGALLEGEQQ
jgi:hypothetical protein